MATEARVLEAEMDADQEAAGVEILAKYGEINVLETLSGGDVTKWEDIKGKPFEVILNKRRLNMDRDIFEKAYAAIIRSKTQGK